MMPIVHAIVLLLFAAAAAPSSTPAMQLTSPAFKSGATIPVEYSYSGYGCSGHNTSPALTWSGWAPQGTKSFALTMFDPDARQGTGWWHWVVFNIPADVTALQAGAGAASNALMPQGAVQARNDFETVGYGGPCPPVGDSPHHYHFTVFAVDMHLDGLSPLTSGPSLLKALRGHVLAKAELIGLFGR